MLMGGLKDFPGVQKGCFPGVFLWFLCCFPWFSGSFACLSVYQANGVLSTPLEIAGSCLVALLNSSSLALSACPSQEDRTVSDAKRLPVFVFYRRDANHMFLCFCFLCFCCVLCFCFVLCVSGGLETSLFGGASSIASAVGKLGHTPQMLHGNSLKQRSCLYRFLSFNRSYLKLKNKKT